MFTDNYFERSSHLYVAYTDLESRFTYVNPLFRQRFGFLAPDFIGLPFRMTVYSDEDVEILAKAARQIMEHPSQSVYVEVRKRAEDAIIWQGYEMSAILAEDGYQPIGIRCLGCDISRSKAEHTRAEQAMDLVNDLIGSMQDGMLLLDSEHKVLLASPFAQKVLAPAGESLVGKVLCNLPVNSLLPTICRRLNGKRLHTQPQRFEVYRPENKMWLHVRLFSHQSGTGLYFKNITAQRRQQTRLVRSEAKLRAILDSQLDEIHYLIEPNFRIAVFNRSAQEAIYRLYDHELKEGEDFRKYILPGTEDIFFDQFRRALNGERIISETEMPLSAELKVWFRVDMRPVRDARGHVLAVAFNAQDINRQKIYEQRLLEQNRQLQAIAFTQSHTLRQPVASILGILHLLDDYDSDRIFSEELLRHLRSLINQLDDIICQIVTESAAAMSEYSKTEL